MKNVWSSVEVKIIGQDATFKPGMNFQALLISRDQDGKPVDTTYQVQISDWSPTDSSSRTRPFTTTKGLVLISTSVPIGATSLSMSVSSGKSYGYANFLSAGSST